MKRWFTSIGEWAFQFLTLLWYLIVSIVRWNKQDIAMLLMIIAIHCTHRGMVAEELTEDEEEADGGT